MSTARRQTSITLLALVLALAAALVTPDRASAVEFAPVDEATITPGVQMLTEGGQCTANFIFTNGADVFIGYAAHCAGTGGQTATNGCETGSLPLGTPVEISGATQPGTLVYSSWEAMQRVGETDPGACAGNDFALVQIAAADVASVNPSLPFWGGPAGVNRDGVTLLEDTYSYGNSSLRPTDSILSRKQGYIVQSTNGGWTHTLYTTSPGIPGDSGSGFLDADGQALGVLSTLALLPLAASNNIADMGRALDYANANGGLGALSLVDGTEAFSVTAPLVGWLL